MSNAVLITQCLQNDMVQPIGRYDEVPSLLHVGHEESRRLMGENPAEGPVALMMRWAYSRDPDDLAIIHVRDWHTAEDPGQADHLHRLGPHCLANTHGAEFAFATDSGGCPVSVIDSQGLDDFAGTSLGDCLESHIDGGLRVGLIGVWTDAKLYFLAYGLKSRFPSMQIAVCSALSASSSKAHHLLALDQMERLLDVRVIPSIGEFVEFLGDAALDIPLPGGEDDGYPGTELDGIDNVTDTDRKILRYLFRDARSVQLKSLAGGYSGNLVCFSKSEDIHGHEQVPHVVKIGEQGEIGQERTSFERIESVMGNNAPRIAEFADYGGRGALKYRYAAMGGGGVSATFKDLYASGLSLEKAESVLDTVFVQQLGRLYAAAKREETNLLEYYRINPSYASRMKQKIELVLGSPADDETLTLPTGDTFPNLAHFYERALPDLLSKPVGSTYFSYVHGDLNASNIIIDGHENVWLIDFALTHYGHVLRDLIKFESDLMYILTPINTCEDLAEAVKLTDILLQVRDLAAPLPEPDEVGITHPDLRLTYGIIRYLRSLYPRFMKEERNALQLLIGQLWYSGRTLTYIESNEWHKLWALYTASHAAARIQKRLSSYGPLRVDWLDSEHTDPGELGITILPGRRDRGRSLSEDIAAMQTQGVTHVVTLLTLDEFADYGVENLMDAFAEAGFRTRRSPMLDGGATSLAEMSDLTEWLIQELAQGANIMVHCLGGLGRSGLVAAGLLVAKGAGVDDAMAIVRRCRSPKAIETRVQEIFLRRFAAAKGIDNGASEQKSVFDSVDDVLAFAITEEQAALNFYANVAAISKDPRVRQMFEVFVEDDRAHIQELSSIREKGAATQFSAALERLDEVLGVDATTALDIEVTPELGFADALRLAMHKEKTGFKLYMNLARFANGEETRAILHSLAEDEARHRLQFEVELEEFLKLEAEMERARQEFTGS